MSSRPSWRGTGRPCAGPGTNRKMGARPTGMGMTKGPSPLEDGSQFSPGGIGGHPEPDPPGSRSQIGPGEVLDVDLHHRKSERDDPEIHQEGEKVEERFHDHPVGGNGVAGIGGPF